MTPETFRQRAERLLRMHPVEEVLPYPPGENALGHAVLNASKTLSPMAAHCRALGQLIGLYQAFDGFVFEDVQNGYFLHSLETIVRDAMERSSSAGSTADLQGAVTIGSSGGGDALIIECATGAIFVVPSHECTSDNRSGTRHRKLVAKSVSEFLEHVCNDVEAFLEGRQSHQYLF
jgi:hypothetical protein